MSPLTKIFFNRPTLVVANELIGANLCRRLDGKIIRLPITEVEAYDGFLDKASHAHKGETPRNKVMFGKAGIWYVYFVYGAHWMLNITTEKIGYPAAILIREVGAIAGPGKLTKHFKIDGSFNGEKALPESGLWIEKERFLPKVRIKRCARIGVDYAGGVWSKKKYRFLAISDD